MLIPKTRRVYIQNIRNKHNKNIILILPSILNSTHKHAKRDNVNMLFTDKLITADKLNSLMEKNN